MEIERIFVRAITHDNEAWSMLHYVLHCIGTVPSPLYGTLAILLTPKPCLIPFVPHVLMQKRVFVKQGDAMLGVEISLTVVGPTVVDFAEMLDRSVMYIAYSIKICVYMV